MHKNIFCNHAKATPILFCVTALMMGGNSMKAADPEPATAVKASSFQPNQGNEPEMAVDGKGKTFWHSAWNPMAPLPQSLTIDYGKVKTMASLVYQPRPKGGNGTVTGFNIYVSADGNTFSKVVADASWPADAKRKFINFGPVEARFMKFEVTSGVGGLASAAEVFTMTDKLDAAPIDPQAGPPVIASSFQPDQNNEPEMAVDGDPATFWHSAWNPKAELPQSFTIDYGKLKPMASFVYQPRPKGGNGTVTGFDLSVSTDGKEFTKVVTGGSWPSDTRKKYVNFEPVQARFVKFDVTAGEGGFASASEVYTMPEKLDGIPPDMGRISVLSPAYGSEIKGRTTIKLVAPGLSKAAVTCWKKGEGFGSDATIGNITFDEKGKGSIDFPADEFQHGPLCVIISATGGDKEDRCCLQLYNQGGVSWNEGMPKDPPPAAAGMTLIFADDFNGPLSISSTDPKATYYDHKPPNGSQDFSEHRFTGFNEPGNPFLQVDTYLRIRADDGKKSSGLISSMKNDGTGVTAKAPCYFECRFIGSNATGAWPAFWLLSDYMSEWVKTKKLDGPCDEIDIIEAYGGDGNGSPNALDKYCVTPHAWNQPQEKKKDAMKQIRAGKGSAQMDHAPQVVSMKNIGIPSNWYQSMHIYAVKMTEADTIYYCDDIEIGRHSTLDLSKKAPFFFLINLATGGGWPVDLSRYGGIADMYVDYVRVYSGNPEDIQRAADAKK